MVAKLIKLGPVASLSGCRNFLASSNFV